MCFSVKERHELRTGLISRLNKKFDNIFSEFKGGKDLGFLPPNSPDAQIFQF